MRGGTTSVYPAMRGDRRPRVGTVTGGGRSDRLGGGRTEPMVIWEVGDDEKAIEGLDEDGNPDPEYAAALGLVRAPFGRRALSAVIDVVIYLLLQLPYWIFALPLILK